MDLSKLEFFGLALGTGFFAGVANFLASMFTDWLGAKRQTKAQKRDLDHKDEAQRKDLEHQETSQARDLEQARTLRREELAHASQLHDREQAARRGELEHNARLQEQEHQHQARVRREADFYKARDELLPLAARVMDWVDYTYGREWGADVDYYQIDRKTPQDSAADVVALLRQIDAMHPRRQVRGFAGSFAGSIDGAYNMPDPDGEVRISEGTMRDWYARCDDLIQFLHDPEHELDERGLEEGPGSESDA